MPADDMTDPAPATTFIHLDATTVLARSLAAKGIYPAVDVLESTSTMLQPWIVGDAHYECAQRVRAQLQRYNTVKITNQTQNSFSINLRIIKTDVKINDFFLSIWLFELPNCKNDYLH